MRVLRRRVAGVLAAVVPLAVVLTPSAGAQAVVASSITITSPTAQASVSGTIGVQFNAALDPAGSATIASFQLVVDGTPTGGTLGCPPPATKSCSAQLLWDATGTSHTLRVRMTSSTGTVLDSAAVPVTVVHPHATVTIASPAAGATVSGPDVEVDTAGSLDNPAAGDQVAWMRLLVDAVPVHLESCDDWSSSSSSCPASFNWDTTAVTPGSHSLTAELTTRSGAVWDSAPLTVHVVAYVPPTVAIVSAPAAGSTVHGTVAITATGVVTSPSDSPDVLELMVDGSPVTWFHCPVGSATCTGTLMWNADAASPGNHTITVWLETDLDSAESESLVLVAGPPTPPVISGPVAWTYFSTGPPSRPVYGSVVLSVDGRIDPASSATAVALQLLVDQQPVGAPIGCPSSSPHVCSISLPWQTRGLTGSHVVQMEFTTTTGTVRSESVTYDVEPYTLGQTSIYVSAGAQTGHELVTGRVSSTTGPLAGAPLTVTVTPAVGAPQTYLATAGQFGDFSLSLGKAFAVTSKVTASLPADFGSASSSYVQEAYVGLTCKLPTKIAHGTQTSLHCTTTPSARNGGKVTLYFQYLHAGVHVLGHGVLKDGKVTITFTTKVKNVKVLLWAKLSRTRTAAPAYTHAIFTRIV